MSDTGRISATKAIRLKCLDCCCGNPNEVRLCTIPNCPLYPFRFGKDPYRKPPSEAQLEAARKKAAKMNQLRAADAAAGPETA